MRSRSWKSFSLSSLLKFEATMDFFKLSVTIMAFLSTGCVHLVFPDFVGGPKKTIYVEAESVYPSQRVLVKLVVETDKESDGCVELKVGSKAARRYIRNRGVPRLNCQSR